MTQTINVKDANDLLTTGQAILIDVREANEFAEQHIPYAISLPLSSLEKDFKQLALPENTVTLVQCLKGSRGAMACETLLKMGRTADTIMNIEGGISAWQAADLPLVGGETQKTLPIIRQVQIVVGLLIALCVILGFSTSTLGFALAGIFGGALFFAGVTGWCGMAKLLMKMPWNRGAA
ncbi:rhodanese-like domain-containing protein [Marinomonas sp.]